MKNILKYSISAMMLLASILPFSSCEDWTDPESLKLNNSSFKEQNPELYAEYIKDLNRYKTSEHNMVFVSFENPLIAPAKQAERLSAIPDSVDFISLNHPENLGPEMQEEISKVREKSTRVIYSINYAGFEAEWKDKLKANPELTEEDALVYLANRTNAMLDLCSKYNLDGVLIDYKGRSLVSLPQDALNQYVARQQNFFNKVMEWQAKHTDKTLIFYGNIQYLASQSMGMLNKYNYIILDTYTSTNAGDFAVKVYLALQAGEEAKGTEEGALNPVPADRFTVSVILPQADDKDKIKGYWNTVDEKGNRIIAALGAAQWVTEEPVDFARKGVFILNINNDYYNKTYRYVREVIRVMNPNK